MVTLSHKVIVIDVVYPAVLLAFGRGIALLPMIVRCKSELQTLNKTFCKVKVLVDADNNVLTDQHDNPNIKVPNPRIELLYTYLGGMVCHALSISDDDRVYIGRLCTVPAEIRTLKLAAYLYILYQEKYPG